MAQCHIKKGNWKRAVETADKVFIKPISHYGWLMSTNRAVNMQGPRKECGQLEGIV